MPNGGASLLLMVSRGKWCRHFRVITVRDVVRTRIVIKELLLMMVMGLLWHHIMLLVGHVNGLSWEIISIIIISICRCVLRMCNKLMMLMEGREFHWRTSRRATSKGWWVR